MPESTAVADAPRHRLMFLLSGSAVWCRATAEEMLDSSGHRQILWMTSATARKNPVLSPGQLHTRLGSELDALVFDAWSGFDPDAFGAASGMLRGGGTMLLLAPPLTEWPNHPDPALRRITPWPLDFREIRSRFLQRLVRLIAATGSFVTVTAKGPVPRLPPPPAHIPGTPGGVCRTTDQQQAVEAICHVLHGHRRRPLVMVANRGRGKSAALGIAAARLLQEGTGQIVVTAPTLQATDFLFQQAARSLPGARSGRGELCWNSGRISFIAPDVLLQRPHPADLLLVDEAAAIPAPLLESLLRRHSRIVFATTIHGYEGTGRGFAVRFRERLDRLTPGWRKLLLHSPIRWDTGDPLEEFTFRALLLNASPAAEAELAGCSAPGCELVELDRERLLRNEALLGELFGLLVLAHYRTRPSDLRNLLDNPSLAVYALLHEGHLAAAALVVREGGLDTELANDIWLGHRRVHGHLLPQSLATYAGFPEAATLRYARIMRLAVHPAVQRRGLGSRLTADIAAAAQAAGLDAIGTSFGATPALLDFWHRSGYRAARIGLRREASSGCHAALMLRPLSERGAALSRQIHPRLREQLPELLASALDGMEPATAWRLLHSLPAPASAPSRQEWRDIASFALGRRGYQVCMAAIKRGVVSALAEQEITPAIAAPERELLVRQVLQGREGSEGSAALHRALRRLLECIRPEMLEIGRNGATAARSDHSR